MGQEVANLAVLDHVGPASRAGPERL